MMKEYIKLYKKMREEYYQEWGSYLHPESMEDFENKNQEIFEEHFKKYNESNDRGLKTKLYIDILLAKIQYFGYYYAFLEGDFENLNNAIWQNGRTCLLEGSIRHSGTAYTGTIITGIFSCFACNDFGVIKSFIPPTMPLLKGTFYTENTINLLHAIYYKDDERLNEAVLKAESFLGKKKLTGIAEYYVRFFLCLAKEDSDGIGECLQKLCEAYQKQGYPAKNIDKCFVPEIHGLYRLVKFLDEGLFDKVEMPSHKCFIKKFEEWQEKQNFPIGRQFYEYPENLDMANKILQRPLPVVDLVNHDGRLAIDVEKFVEELSYREVK